MKIIKIYDNNGKTLDRYTVVVDIQNENGIYDCLALSDNPDHQGISLWTSCRIGNHLGNEIEFSDLPKHIQEHIRMRLEED